MKDILIPILTFFSGFYVKQFFDNRDLRRKILEPEFEEFEKNIIYLQTEWRNKQARNINNKQSEEYSEEFNSTRDKLIKSKNNIIFACKKIQEEELPFLIEEAFTTLLQGMSGYGLFLENREIGDINDRQELIKILHEAHAKFDDLLPVSLEKVYNRYWKIISSTLIYDSIKKLFNQIKAKVSHNKTNSADVKSRPAD